MKYVGLDLHKAYSYITELDEEGKVLSRFRLENTPENIRRYAQTLPPGSKVAVEATYNWYFLLEILEEMDLEVTLAHPLKTRAIASARIMTDKISSRILASLLWADLLPPAYIAPRPIRDRRELLRYRASLVSLRQALKCKVRALLSKNGIEWSYTDVFGKGSIERLKGLRLRSVYKMALEGYISLGKLFNYWIDKVTKEIERRVEEDADAMLLTTIPGIGYYSALLILSEIGEISRFPSAGHLCSYAGLVPSVHSSGGKVRYGKITKQGSKWLRWIVVECSHHAIGGTCRFEELYKRVMERRGKSTARVAVARDLLKVIYHMLKHKEVFRDGHRGRRSSRGWSSPWGHDPRIERS
ncbi:MAG: IS110 family transposase [Fidelibacterota bacterium]